MAQVTIGSVGTPVGGALLQLKEDEGATNNAKSGLGMPRVELKDKAKLKMGASEILDTDNGGEQYGKRTGLLVYNTADVGDFSPGLYIWDSKAWQKIGEKCLSLELSKTGPLYFASGLDLRTIIGQPVALTWTRLLANAPTSAVYGSFGAIGFDANSFMPTPSSAWTNGQAVTIKPTGFAAADISSNPFRTKESEVTFSVTERSKTVDAKIIINQTNKAITLTTTHYDKPTSGLTYQNTIKSNAKWHLSKIEPSDGTSVFSNIQLNGAALAKDVDANWEQNNNAGQGATNNLAYTLTTGAAKARFSKLTFSDSETGKRFADITISVYQCSNIGIMPRMNEWAAIAGFPHVPDTKISDADDIAKGRDVANTTTGIAWHGDQDGNIFLSGSFATGNTVADITGNSERWMITNLAAKKYDTNANNPHRTLNTVGNYNAGNAYNTAYWAYPNIHGSTNGDDNSLYAANPRLGLFYTWDAATAGKGGNLGQLGGNEGGSNHARVQGICPSGWHLPSDYEWTVLENNIIYRTNTFSSTANIAAGTPNFFTQSSVAENYWRGTYHGKAMKEPCETFGDGGAVPNNANQCTSKPISTTARPGFDALLVAYATNGTANAFSSIGFFWSSSSYDTINAWIRGLGRGYSQVHRSGEYARYFEFSVRCKKD